jgi:hypothetical protein
MKAIAAVSFTMCLLAVGPSGRTQQRPTAGAQTVAPSSGKDMCSALTPADFTKAGVPVTALRDANVDDSSDAYCIYQSAAGNLEFDIFFPAGDTPDAAKGAVRAAKASIGGKFEAVSVTGADSAEVTAAAGPAPGKPASACIVVRKGKAVFNIGVPQGEKARQELIDLAQVVLSRLKT